MRFNLVIEGKVYIVSNIMTDKYPDEKPFYICSRKYFRMDIAPQDFQEKFKDIIFIDGKISGTVMGVVGMTVYQSCPHCFCSLKAEEATECEVCQQVITDVREDFRCTLVVECKDTGEGKNITCFKKSFDVDIKISTRDELEVELNQTYFGRETEIEFTTKIGKDGETDMIVHSLKFL